MASTTTGLVWRLQINWQPRMTRTGRIEHEDCGVTWVKGFMVPRELQDNMRGRDLGQIRELALWCQRTGFWGRGPPVFQRVVGDVSRRPLGLVPAPGEEGEVVTGDGGGDGGVGRVEGKGRKRGLSEGGKWTGGEEEWNEKLEVARKEVRRWLKESE